jgi:hypothetical protein
MNESRIRAIEVLLCAALVASGTTCVRESAVKEPDTATTMGTATAADSARSRGSPADSVPVAAVAQLNDSSQPPLRCAPQSFAPGDTLTLTMRVPHGDYLTVTPPDGPTHFIVYPQWGNPRRRFSLIQSDDFKRVSTLRLPSDVRAIARVINRDTIPEPVFATPGKYILRMGEDFEGDYGNVAHTCLLNFDSPRK